MDASTRRLPGAPLSIIMRGLGVATVAVLTACGPGGAPAASPPTNSEPTSQSTTASTAASEAPGAASAPESNPAGDIPDNQAFVPYTSPDGTFSVSVPEGWSRITEDGGVRFTDKLNSVRVAQTPEPAQPTVESVRSRELPALAASVPGYQSGEVRSVRRQAGSAVLVTYGGQSAPDPVTNKSRLDAVERYEFWHAGQLVVVTLSGPQGADNVDPWRTVTDSMRWLR